MNDCCRLVLGRRARSAKAGPAATGDHTLSPAEAVTAEVRLESEGGKVRALEGARAKQHSSCRAQREPLLSSSRACR